MIPSPKDAQTMIDVRRGVDDIDTQLVALLAKRFDYMTAAARIKTDPASVRDENRKAQVIEAVKSHARAGGVPEPLVAALWEMLIESSIAYEQAKFAAARGLESPADAL